MSTKVRPSRESILAARKTTTVEIPEIGETFILRELSVGEMRKLSNDDIAQQLSLMIVDESGTRRFDDEEGVQILSELSASVTMRLIAAAAKINNVGQAVVDDVVKNLMASPTDGSGSASQ